MIAVILFKTRRGFLFSPLLLDVVNQTEETLTQYEDVVKENHTVEYTKRFETLEECKKYVKQELGITDNEFQKLIGYTPKQLEDAPSDYTR